MTDETESSRPQQASEFDASLETDSEGPAHRLLALLESEYDSLLRRLSAHLRSPEAAAEALHDVYVKLRSEPSIGDLRSPRSYLYRMAVNLAINRRRSEWRTVNLDVAELSEFPDSTPDQEAAVLAADEMDRALEALHSLPLKRQAIFLARWRDEKQQNEIAADFGLRKRSVQKELVRAETYLRKILRRPKGQS